MTGFWLRRLRAATLSAWTVWGVAAGIILVPQLVSAVLAHVFGLGEDAARAAEAAAGGLYVATAMGRLSAHGRGRVRDASRRR